MDGPVDPWIERSAATVAAGQMESACSSELEAICATETFSPMNSTRRRPGLIKIDAPNIATKGHCFSAGINVEGEYIGAGGIDGEI